MNLAHYFGQLDETSVDQHFQQALNGDTTRVAEVWRDIASGAIDVTSALIWAQHVARRIQTEVVDADLTGVQRPRAALAAIGFRGPVDKHRAAKEDMSVYLDFFPDAVPPEILDMLQRRGHLVDMPRKVALTRIAEWHKQS